MFDVSNLAKRINNEFSSAAGRDKGLLGGQGKDAAQQRDRLEQLGKVFDELREIWKPRLELLVKEFGYRVKTTPHVVPSMRDVTFSFLSRFANIRLRFTALPDRDFQQVVLSFLLEITPAVIHYQPYAQLEFPLSAVDKEVAAKWFDDRIMDFVQTYLAIEKIELFPKDQMVEDPVAGVQFPKFAAAATLEWEGQKFYFISEDTRRKFETEKQTRQGKTGG
jgi:YHS domain-containing protein